VARRDPAAAARRIATGAGLRLMATIRRGFTSFVAAQQRLSVRRAAHNDDERRRAVLLGGLAIGGSALLILIYSSYLFRLVTVPVRRIAEGARRLSAGDLAAQVPERGVGEIGELARDFNAMARSLDERGRQLRRQNAELQAVLDATLDGILMTDKEGNVLFSNRTIDRFWGEVGLRDEGTIWDRLVRLARRTTTPDAYYELFARIADDPNEVVDEEFTLADTKRTFTGHTAAVKDSSGGIVGRIFSIREVTALRESERLKDEFVATVSHELRTPLTSIVGYTELLLEPDGLSGSQRSHLEAIERNAERLQRLVGDLLFFAQVESGELQLDRQTVDLRALGERAVNTAIPNAVEKGLSLELDAPERVHVEGDRGRVEQLLDNLLSNAVKFTPAGGRGRVRLRRDGDAALLEVSDTGIGIPDEEIDQLFRRFFRATSATTREIQGTGLGLAIAKAIVDAHGGEIAASSSGGGATFSVRLPLAPAGALATSPDAPKVSRRL
jgi:signal transduction histidine kinase